MEDDQPKSKPRNTKLEYEIQQWAESKARESLKRRGIVENMTDYDAYREYQSQLSSEQVIWIRKAHEKRKAREESIQERPKEWQQGYD